MAGCGPAVQRYLSDENKSSQRVPEKRLRLADGSTAKSSLLIEVSPDAGGPRSRIGGCAQDAVHPGALDVQPSIANRSEQLSRLELQTLRPLKHLAKFISIEWYIQTLHSFLLILETSYNSLCIPSQDILVVFLH